MQTQNNEILKLLASNKNIEFELKYSMKNGNKVTQKNWHKVVAVALFPCTNVHGNKNIDRIKAEFGEYYETWALKYEEPNNDKNTPGGYIFREINHNGGINGHHKTFKQAIWFAIKPGRIKVVLPTD